MKEIIPIIKALKLYLIKLYKHKFVYVLISELIWGILIFHFIRNLKVFFFVFL